MLTVFMAATATEPGAEPVRSFAAVVHPSNPMHDVRLRDVASFFEGANRQWPNNAPVVLVERDTSSAPYRYLMSRVLNTTPMEYKRRLQSIEYRGEAPVAIKVLNSDEAACQFVFNVPTAIAIIEAQSLHSAACAPVQVLRIEGNVFQNAQDPITSVDSDTVGFWDVRDNQFINCSGSQPTTSNGSFTPPYSYILDSSANVQALVTQFAGVGKTDPLQNLP